MRLVTGGLGGTISELALRGFHPGAAVVVVKHCLIAERTARGLTATRRSGRTGKRLGAVRTC
jgi:hypothetical protein